MAFGDRTSGSRTATSTAHSRRRIEYWCASVRSTRRGRRLVARETVQSVVFQAIGYASKLDSSRIEISPRTLFGPRPEKLMDTHWAAVERPLYVMGLRDAINGIIATLDASVGRETDDMVDPMEDGDEEDGDVIEGDVVERPRGRAAADNEKSSATSGCRPVTSHVSRHPLTQRRHARRCVGKRPECLRRFSAVQHQRWVDGSPPTP
jgi:hypothetical protein